MTKRVNVVITSIILGAKKRSVNTNKTLSELTSCSGVSGDDRAKFIVGIVTASAPSIDAKAKKVKMIFIII